MVGMPDPPLPGPTASSLARTSAGKVGARDEDGRHSALPHVCLCLPARRRAFLGSNVEPAGDFGFCEHLLFELRARVCTTLRECA